MSSPESSSTFSSTSSAVSSPASSAAKLFIWRDRSLFVSAVPLPQRGFTVTADQLVVCLQGETRVQTLHDGEVAARSFLLRAGTAVDESQVDATGVLAAACYLNPIGQDYHVVKEFMTGRADDALVGHQHEDHIIAQLLYIRDHSVSSGEAYDILEQLIIPPDMQGKVLQEYDPRIVQVLNRIRETVRENMSIANLAAEVFLSESRLVKLFKDQIGIPITRYRLRYRVYVGVVHLSLGRSVTDSALAAGFAGTAHFSKCYRAMFGMQPSAGFLRPPYVDIILADDIREAAELVSSIA